MIKTWPSLLLVANLQNRDGDLGRTEWREKSAFSPYTFLAFLKYVFKFIS